MATMGPYDGTLQMFVQTPQPIDMSRLTFLRWLAEQGRLEHGIAGAAAGPLVTEVVNQRLISPDGKIGGGSSESELPARPIGEYMTRRIEGLGPARERGV